MPVLRVRLRRQGGQRYVLEPNVKEGKGGLRDLHTLFWIGKYLHKVESVDDLVRVGLLTGPELRQFRRAESFFWAVRWQLHDIRGRADERLTFDVQPEIARRMGWRGRGDELAVERFMRRYFLTAMDVGALTRQAAEAGASLVLFPEATMCRFGVRSINTLSASVVFNFVSASASDFAASSEPMSRTKMFRQRISPP